MWSGDAGALGAALGALLLPLEVGYRVVVWARNRAYALGALPVTPSPVPVVSVGNLAVGGTGKTPFSGWLVTRLAEAGRLPALVTRGYGSDEVLLHEAWNPNAIVIADARRSRGILQAVERGADVVVLDDGFQHRAVERTVDIVLVAAEHGTRRALLPRGRLRESTHSLSRAHAVIVTRKSASRAEAERVLRALGPGGVRGLVALEASEWTGLHGEPLAPPGGQGVLAVTSVADPKSFRSMVGEHTGASVESLAYRDHHEFRDHDVKRIASRAGGRPIVTTEKDAVKLVAFGEALPTTYVLRLRVTWERGRAEVMRLIDHALEGT